MHPYRLNLVQRIQMRREVTLYISHRRDEEGRRAVDGCGGTGGGAVDGCWGRGGGAVDGFGGTGRGAVAGCRVQWKGVKRQLVRGEKQQPHAGGQMQSHRQSVKSHLREFRRCLQCRSHNLLPSAPFSLVQAIEAFAMLPHFCFDPLLLFSHPLHAPPRSFSFFSCLLTFQAQSIP